MSIPEYLSFSKLRKIWSPADSAKLAEHAAKFDGLPLMARVTRAFYPELDGDIAELDELADRVIAGIGATGSVCVDDDIYEQMCWWFNLSSWPTDHVAELLADWPTPIIERVTGQAAVA